MQPFILLWHLVRFHSAFVEDTAVVALITDKIVNQDSGD